MFVGVRRFISCASVTPMAVRFCESLSVTHCAAATHFHRLRLGISKIRASVVGATAGRRTEVVVSFGDYRQCSRGIELTICSAWHCRERGGFERIDEAGSSLIGTLHTGPSTMAEYTIPTTAIVSYTEHDWRYERVLCREPGPGELLIRMLATGICHTDLANVVRLQHPNHCCISATDSNRQPRARLHLESLDTKAPEES